MMTGAGTDASRRDDCMKPLAGTAALVTGASSGIGRATARRLALDGADVALVARRNHRLDELAREVGAAGGCAFAVAADITDEEAAAAAVGVAVDRLGRLDIVVNNAGLMLLGPVLGAPADEWHKMIDLNLKGLLAITRSSAEHLVKAAVSEPRRVADVVNVGSIAGRSATKGMGVYNMTKWGVSAFSESLRQEMTAHNVRVSVIQPGATATELSSHNRPEVMADSKKRMQGVTRQSPDDVADAISYVVTRPREVAIAEIVIRPSSQA